MRNKLFVSFLIILLSISVTHAQTYESFGKIVGVDNQGKGVVGNVSVEIQPGKGRILINTEPLTGVYTQDSERIAVQVTSEITKFDFSQYDAIYTIKTPNANIVEGPSAGSMMTLATIAAIEGKTLSSSFSMTGTIQEDHTIGKIGGVLTKAKSAADSGVTVFLIPKGQSIQYEYVRKTKTPSPGWVVETIEPLEVDIKELAKERGMQVYEVSTIEEAVKYAFGEIPTGKVKRTQTASPITIPSFSSPVSMYNEFGTLSSATVRQAQSTYNQAKNKLDQSIIPDDVKGTLDLFLTGAQLLLNEANTIDDHGYKYSAGNNAFRSIISAETAMDLIDYYSLPQEARKNFLVKKVNEAKNEIATMKADIESQTKNAICDANKFEWAVAAQERITYAENRVAAIAIPVDGNTTMKGPADILFDVNIAKEWLTISKGFASKANSNVASDCLEKFKTEANEILTEARTSVIVAQTKGSRTAEDGKWFLDAAQKEYDQGWYITAIYDATAAKVRSETGGKYESMGLTEIYGDFNKETFITSDLIGTIFYENAQYNMYTAIKEDDKSSAIEAIVLLNLAKGIDSVHNEVKIQLAVSKPEFRVDTQLIIGLLFALLLLLLFYVNKLWYEVKRMKDVINRKESKKIRKRR